MSLRSWTRSTLRALNNTLNSPRPAHGPASHARAYRRALAAESLEPRLFLTTLRGASNDSFEYVDVSGEIIRVNVTGNIDVELVGATVNGLTNTAEAVNLSGRLNTVDVFGNPTAVDVFGGLGGPGGIDIIGPVFSPTGDADINALAADSGGLMYAFELQEVPIPNPPAGSPDSRKLVFLVQLTFPPPQPPPFPLPPPYGARIEEEVTLTRLAEISDEIIAQSGGLFSVVNSVPAADFNPSNGLLYFAATGGTAAGGGGGATASNIDKLFTIDVNAANVEASVSGIAGTFNDVGGDGGITVSSIAFDQTSGGTQLVALLGDDDGAGGGGGAGGVGGGSDVVAGENPFLVVVDPTNSDNFLSVTNLTLFDPNQSGGGGANDDVPALSGIEILDENPNEIDDLLAVGANARYQIIREAAATQPIGTVFDLGPLEEPPPLTGDPPDDPTGGAPSGLMFVPGMLDPFTNTLGAYVAFDTAEESNKLFFVNRLEQRAGSIFQIYVASSDETGRIFISRVPPLEDDDRRMTPFAGDVGGVRHRNADDPGQFPWPVDTAGQPVGQVFIGARTIQIGDETNGNMIPILTASIPPAINLGLLPVGLLPIGTDGRRIVDAGMTINGNIDRVAIAGAVTGAVVANGSINQFYAGWLLTGDARGEIGNVVTRPQNFRVEGDLRDLYVLDSIGTQDDAAFEAPTYNTGFDLRVRGTVGQVRTGDSWVGAFQVRNQPEEDATFGLNITQSEVEFKTTNETDLGPWEAFEFGQNEFFFNDSFSAPQFLGAIAANGQADMVDVLGTVQHSAIEPLNDWVDYYAVALMAGQTVQVQLFPRDPIFAGLLNIGVFDPDGRLIASDYSNSADISGTLFGFTTDRPGSYRFAVSVSGNGNFTDAQVVTLNEELPYQMRVTGVGDIAFGGLAATNNIFDVAARDTSGGANAARGYVVEFGDLGSFRAGGAIISDTLVSTRVLAGNLRELDGASIGVGTASAPGDPANPDDPGTAAALRAPPEIDVPSGSVGLIRARTGILALNASALAQGRSIGGDFQVIDGISSVAMNIVADGGLGILRAGDMATVPASTITLNFDDNGRDGIIDLIDVVGQFGTLGAGGPGIRTNTGGNVRYMRVGGLAFIDAEFGGGTPIRTLHLPGEIVTLTDDGGAALRLIPAGVPVPNPDFVPNDPTGAEPQFLFLDPNALTVRSYPIRGSGGVVVLDITTDDSITIETSGGNGGTAEIGTILVTGARAVGQGVVRDPTRRVGDFTTLLDFFVPESRRFDSPFGFDPLNPGTGGGLGEPDYRSAPQPLIRAPRRVDPITGIPVDDQPIKDSLEVIIRGNVKTDVFSIVGQEAGEAGDAQFSLISNETDGGELVNITAVSVVEIVSNGTIGLAKSSIAGLALRPAVSATGATIPFPSQEFPFVGTSRDIEGRPIEGNRMGVWIYGDIDEDNDAVTFLDTLNLLAQDLPEPGNVISIRARDGLGNIIVNGSIGEIQPNKDNLRNRPGIFAGIQGVIWARGNPETAAVAFGDSGGDLYFVDIGEGVAASGSGEIARAGIFAGRRIDTVQGRNADIRGDIVAGDLSNPFFSETVQQTINGQQVFAARRISIPDSIGRIVLTDGSIINADVMVTSRAFESREQGLNGLTTGEFPESLRETFFEIGKIDIRGNGGIIGGFFSASDVGPIDVNRGFGIFNSAVVADAGGRFAGFESDNYGIRGVSSNSGSVSFLNARGDGGSVSTAAFSESVRHSEAQLNALDAFGVDPLTGFAPNILTDIHAFLGTSQTTPDLPGRTDTGVIEDVRIVGQRDLGTIRAQQIRSVSPDLLPSVINFANRISNVFVRDQINGLSMTTGRIENFKPQGDVFNLDLTVAGPIKDLVINGDLADGSVIRTQGKNGKIGNIRVTGRLDGDILSSGGIKRLFVGESVSGSVSARNRRGNAIGQLILGGALAEGGLNIDGNVGRLVVAGNFGVTGTDFVVNGKVKSLTITGDLFSNIRIAGAMGKLQVGGSIISGATVEIGGKLGSLIVGRDIQAGATVRATRIGKERIGGQLLGNVVEG